ncbi:MAG: Clp protease N-terminal domain-containing protein [Longimicrobiales bacterium]
MNRAAAAAARDGVEAVEPKHILAGVLSEGDPVFQEILGRLDLPLAALPSGFTDAPGTYEGHLPYTPPSHDLLTAAVDFMTAHQHGGVSSVHLFVGALSVGDPQIDAALEPWDLDGGRFEDEVRATLAPKE